MYLRLRIWLQPLHQVADGVVDQEKVALLRHVERGRAGTFLEERPRILHELIVEEADAYGTLQHFQVELLEQEIVADALRNLRLVRRTCSCGQRLDCLDYQVAREVAANQADHLVVVQGCYYFVVRGRMKHLLNLLEERFSVELRCGNKSVFAKKDVLSAKSCVEIFVEQVEGSLISALKNDLDCVLKVNAHLVCLQVLLCALIESVFCSALLALDAEDAPRRWLLR